MKELVGKTIKSIFIDDTDSFLVFNTNRGRVPYITTGECCSSSWFHSILGVEALIGAEVYEVEKLDLSHKDFRMSELESPYHGNELTEHYVIKVYGYKITTNNGRATIEFRNSSSGHYRGSLEYWGGYKRRIDMTGMTEIKDDWNE